MTYSESDARRLQITEPRSGLSVSAILFPERAPENADFLWAAMQQPRAIESLHAMWTGPEISCPVPAASLDAELRAKRLPLEHATITPAPGDVVLTWLPPFLWGGGPDPVFDIGLYYGPGARCLFPIGWQAGSVVARVAAEQVAELAAACGRIRRNGVCTITFARA